VKSALKIVGGVLVLVILVVSGAVFWAGGKAKARLAVTYDTHTIDFPIPFPLSEEEVAEAGLTPEEAEAVALERAVARGKHLVEGRYACSECHGQDFAGGVMVDAAPIGKILGPNLTGGTGSRVGAFTAADWDRIVRHGVLPGDLPAAMPSEDYREMSDQELSDIISFIRSYPAVSGDPIPRPTLGPLGKVLMATGQIRISAESLASRTEHRGMPPMAEPSVEFGAHLAATCVGCHNPNLTGGPIPGGDPAWAEARNLTPHEEGLAGWSYDDFRTAMRTGLRPDGSQLQVPMTLVIPVANNMTDVETEALWAYLSSLEPRPTGQ
jgi:mono/diheme cytochrome c family protein